MMSALEIVQNQLEAYNRRDIDSFISFYSSGITIKSLSGELILEGMMAFRQRYLERFSNPKLHCAIENRIVFGNRVIDYEKIEGIDPTGVYEVVVIYEISGEKIIRLTIIPKG